MRGEGVWLYDAGGARYLDMYNNVAHVGHCHPHVVEAICRQAAMLNTHTRYLHENVVDYAERLTAKLPDTLDTAMFCCTGSEANELALRIARSATRARGVIVTDFAYHGNSQATWEISPEDCAPEHRPDAIRGVARLLRSPREPQPWPHRCGLLRAGSARAATSTGSPPD